MSIDLDPTAYKSDQDFLNAVLPGRSIVFTFVHPPIPVRQFDYQATLDTYDPEPGTRGLNGLRGWGKTEAEAAEDLCQLISGELPDDYEPPLPSRIQAEIERDMKQAMSQVEVWDHFLDKLIGGA